MTGRNQNPIHPHEPKMIMKTSNATRTAALAFSALVISTHSSFAQSEDEPRTFGRFVPERSDDFAWENDKVAFRAYGPALRQGTENGGIDCWLKRVDYPIIDKWYKGEKQGKSYHTDHGEGYDPYHVGSSLGCGGFGLWIDGKIVNTETYVSWKVVKSEPGESVFELNYEWDHGGHSYKQTKRISIKLGDRLFHTVATTWKDGALAVDLPAVIGLTTHDGKAKPGADARQGWMACWEKIDNSGLGTGVVMDPSAIESYKVLKSKTPDESHALFITKTDNKGQVSWWAGYGWERAGEIESAKDWSAYLKDFPKGR